jgi:uncharacterized protein
MDALVASLSLVPHPEGGYFRQYYASDHTLSQDLDRSVWEAGSTRTAVTAIHYLCPGPSSTPSSSPHPRSSLHRIKSDELWFHLSGSNLIVVELLPPAEEGGDAVVRETLLGNPTGPPVDGVVPTPTHVVKGGVCFGAYCPTADSYALVSCVVAPGFDYRDWSMQPAEELYRAFPGKAAAAAIARLAKDL